MIGISFDGLHAIKLQERSAQTSVFFASVRSRKQTNWHCRKG
jgi:hypothetical protein